MAVPPYRRFLSSACLFAAPFALAACGPNYKEPATPSGDVIVNDTTSDPGQPTGNAVPCRSNDKRAICNPQQ